MPKHCEVCGAEIPADFGNLLCMDCYNKRSAAPSQKIPPEVLTEDPARFGLTDPNYQCNPEADDKEQWQANLDMFARTGKLLWNPTRDMYTFIRTYCLNKITESPQYPKFIWKPKIVDVGCGIGAGSNVLSEEADFVWGIDKNEKSIQFAKEAFTRNKNGIYYSSQVTFDRIDIMTDTREFAEFDIVVAIEVFEHIADHRKFVETIIKKFNKKKPHGAFDGTEFFFSTPNRNNDSIRKDKPYNKYHVKELTSQEFYSELSRYFKEVKFYNSRGEPIEGINTNHTPLLAKCNGVK